MNMSNTTHTFNDLQVAALSANAVMLVVAIVHIILVEVNLWRARQFSKWDHVAHRLVWGFWPIGFDVVRFVHGEGTTEVEPLSRAEVYRTRPFCCCVGVRTTTHSYNLQEISVSVQRHPLTPWAGAGAFFMACFIGIFVHFLPCLSWTCDWGPRDQEGVRGGIWFALWILLFIVFVAVRQRMLCVSPNGNNNKAQNNCCVLAIDPPLVSGGSALYQKIAHLNCKSARQSGR